VGQYKRGKSTFLNALIGEPILPIGVVPVTSAITVILHGKRRSARVRFMDGNVLQIAPAELRDYVAEDENPGNAKQVALIELFWPSPLLATGLCLVDTPGVGSIYAWNTEVTRAFVPQVDAALVLVGADPPLSELEMELVEQLSRQRTTLLFALNKADRMAPSEVSEAREFTQRALVSRLSRKDLRIYEVSATERLLGGPTRDWAQLEGELAYLAQSSARALVQKAQQRGVERFVTLLKHEVDVRLEALQKPLNEQDAKLEAAESEIAQAERSIPALFLENAEDQLRMESDLERRREAFLKAAVPRGRAELDKALASAKERGPALQTAGVQQSRRIALTLLDVWSKELSRLIETNFREVLERMVPYAHDFVRKVSPSSMATFKELRKTVDTSAGPPLPPALAEPTFRPSKIPEAVLWTESGVKLQTDELAGYLRRLVDTSTILMARQARERYREKQRKLEADMRKWMEDVASVANRALERSRDMHRAGSEAVRTETARLKFLLPELDALVTLQAHRTAAASSEPMPRASPAPVPPPAFKAPPSAPPVQAPRPSQAIAGAVVANARARAAAAAEAAAPPPVAIAPAPPSRPRMALPALDVPVPRTTPVPPPAAPVSRAPVVGTPAGIAVTAPAPIVRATPVPPPAASVAPVGTPAGVAVTAPAPIVRATPVPPPAASVAPVGTPAGVAVTAPAPSVRATPVPPPAASVAPVGTPAGVAVTAPAPSVRATPAPPPAASVAPVGTPAGVAVTAPAPDVRMTPAPPPAASVAPAGTPAGVAVIAPAPDVRMTLVPPAAPVALVADTPAGVAVTTSALVVRTTPVPPPATSAAPVADTPAGVAVAAPVPVVAAAPPVPLAPPAPSDVKSE